MALRKLALVKRLRTATRPGLPVRQLLMRHRTGIPALMPMVHLYPACRFLARCSMGITLRKDMTLEPRPELGPDTYALSGG